MPKHSRSASSRLSGCSFSGVWPALLCFARTLCWDAVLLAHPDEAATLGALDQMTVAITRNHHYSRDLLSLRFSLQQSLPYIGLIGQRE